MPQKSLSLLAFAACGALALAGFAYAQGTPNLAGTYSCGPDAKACEWSGTTFTVTQMGDNLEVKNEKGETGQGKVTSNISVAMGPPWNMLGTILPQNGGIEWSNGTLWRKQ